MTRIKIVDLPQDATISAEEMKKVFGGYSLTNTAVGSAVSLNPTGFDPDNLVLREKQVLPDLGGDAGWFFNCRRDNQCCHAVAGVRG